MFMLSFLFHNSLISETFMIVIDFCAYNVNIFILYKSPLNIATKRAETNQYTDHFP